MSAVHCDDQLERSVKMDSVGLVRMSTYDDDCIHRRPFIVTEGPCTCFAKGLRVLKYERVLACTLCGSIRGETARLLTYEIS